jgi:hypothetical protein
MQARFLTAGLLALGIATAAHAQATLERKLTPGKATVTSTTKVHQLLSIAGQEVPVDVESTSTSTVTTGSRGADGAARIVHKTDATKFNLSVQGMKIEFDSARPDGAKADNQMFQAILDGLKGMIGAELTYVYDKNNKVVAVEGADKVLAALPESSRMALKDQLDPERIKLQANQELGVLPDGPVKQGDRWKRTETRDLGSGQKLDSEVYYEYLGTVEKNGKTYDKIGMFVESVKFGIAEDAPIPIKLVSSDLKAEASSGTILFDRELGTVVESTSSLRVTGPMVLSVMGMELPAKLDLTMEGQSTSKR